MASDHPVLDLLRGHIQHLKQIRDHLEARLEHVMEHLQEAYSAGEKLISLRQAADDRADAAEKDRDAEKAGRLAAEQERDDLKTQIASAESTLAEFQAKLEAEVSKESPAPSQGSGSGSEPSTPVVTTPSAGVTVTVDPTAGTTTHEDATTGVTTTVDHATGDATATTASGQTVEPNPADVETAVSSAAAAGVTVPAAS